MSVWKNRTIQFWDETYTIEQEINIFFKALGTLSIDGWPASFTPSIQEILDELSISKSAHIAVKNMGTWCKVDILTGNIILLCSYDISKDKLDVRCEKFIIYASNTQKVKIRKRSKIVEYKGIYLVDNHNKFLTRYRNSVTVANVLMQIAYTEEHTTKESKDEAVDEDYHEKIESIAQTLEAYIDKEYEIEEIKAREEKPFVYIKISPEPIVSNYKYYYRLTLTQTDAKRVRELAPKLLDMKLSSQRFQSFEVYELSPKDSEYDIVLTTAEQLDTLDIEEQSELYLSVQPTLKKVRQKVIDELKDKKSRNHWILPLAAGVYNFQKSQKIEVPEYDKDRPLLEAQKDGVDKGAGSKDITLVLGPPGTGKTTVILSWVKFFSSQGLKILVASQNNKAVDNVLERIDKEEGIECIRVGNESKVSSSIHHLLIENYGIDAQKRLIDNLNEIVDELHDGYKYLDDLKEAFVYFIEYDDKVLYFKNRIIELAKELKTQEKNLKYNQKIVVDLSEKSDYCHELLEALRYCYEVKELKNSITFQNELCSNLENDIKKSIYMISRLEKHLGALNEKLGKRKNRAHMYESASKIIKTILYFSNRVNLQKIELLEKDISLESKNVYELKKKVKNKENQKLKIDSSTPLMQNYLESITAAVPTFKHNITIKNCEKRYLKFFKLRTFFTFLGFDDKHSLHEKVKITLNGLKKLKESFLKTQNRIVECKQNINQVNEDLQTIKNQQESHKSSTPVMPTYRPCKYIDDKIYVNFYPDKSNFIKMIAKLKADALYYKELYFAISLWQKEISSNRQSSLYRILLEYVDVVGATCIGINSNRHFDDIPFDVVIIDESGQIQLHNLMVPLSRAPKAILVGDHKQLPPVVDEEMILELSEQDVETEFMKKSWFEILWDKTPETNKTMLDTQFRCPSHICDFVSRAFYDGKYKTGGKGGRNEPILPDFNSATVFIDTSKVYPGFEQSKKSDNRVEIMGNKVETEVVFELFSKLIKELPYLAMDNEIGVIVPYKNHVNEVKKKIRSSKIDLGNLHVEDLVASIDSYQGQERDVIILAFSRSNKEGAIGFLADWRRLNVAMTRTKKQLIMIGNLRTLTKDRQKAHEKEFKNAMKMLARDFSGSIMDANLFLKGFGSGRS